MVLSNGEVADSTTEGRFFEAFTKAGASFEYQYKVLLSEKAAPKNKGHPLTRDSGVNEISMTVDFVFEFKGARIFVDAKGSEKSTLAESKLKYRFLKAQLWRDGYFNDVIVFVYAIQIKELLLTKSHVQVCNWLLNQKRL